MTEAEEWCSKAMRCPENTVTQAHNWMPMSWSITPKSKHVQNMMCTRCFHEINIGEAYKYRTKLE